MTDFFGEDVLLHSDSARALYAEVKDLPIIDYHCHLDEKLIQADACFSDIGALWLAGDHYKWRAMRLCGVDETFITGKADYREKFLKYAEIMPQLIGNPLYYWTHLELKQIFGITEPLNRDSAIGIYERANETLRRVSVRSLLRQYRVEYIATTDDPCSDLSAHGVYGGTTVAPTFRPDKLLALDENAIGRLGQVTGRSLETLPCFLAALEERIAYFAEKGCRISDHGFLRFPARYIGAAEAEKLYQRRKDLTASEKEVLFGYLLVALARLYGKYRFIMQLHFSVARNVNPAMFSACGADAGFDIIADPSNVENVAAFFSQIPDGERPETILYTLNDGSFAALSALTGAFRHVKIGAAWWFNDTLEGIKKNLKTIAEYAVLGTHYGMLTDSRSFSSYSRFDFFRRILCDFIGGYAERGEYDFAAAKTLVQDISYFNIKRILTR